jgi:hypothetical protein
MFHPLCPWLRKNIKKISLVLKDKTGGKFAIFYVSCWILADIAFVVHHLSSLFLACCHNYSDTFLGEQLGQVLWTLIQHCYLLLSCVPHTYTAFEPSQAPPSPEQNR